MAGILDLDFFFLPVDFGYGARAVMSPRAELFTNGFKIGKA